LPLLTMSERDLVAKGQISDDVAEQRRRAGGRTMGGALVSRLLASAAQRGVTVSANCGVERLAPVPGGWTLTVPGETIRARSVVLATGGYEWNDTLQKAFLPHPVAPSSAPSDTGDGLRLGLGLGAAVAS